ncbi:MAG: hypothetical protein AAGC56_02860 [Pseudomonadota bacterium]
MRRLIFAAAALLTTGAGAAAQTADDGAAQRQSETEALWDAQAGQAAAPAGAAPTRNAPPAGPSPDVSPASSAGAPSGMGALAAYLPQTGGAGAWRYRNAGATFALSNQTDPNSIEYVYVGALDGQDRRVAATVALEGGAPQGFAGLLLGFDGARKAYHVFSISPNGGVSIFKRDEGGFRPTIQSTTDAVRAGPNVLEVREQGDSVTFLVNGTEIAELASAGLGSGDVGIAAGGLVDALYTNFSVAPAQ